MEGTPFGPYRLLQLLGRGGMGEVWRAYDTTTDRVVALKVLHTHLSHDREFLQRFRREARAVTQLNNRHVIPIHTHGEMDGQLYLDMRLVEGRDLSEVLTDGPLEPRRAVGIIEQIAKALDAAHQVGLVHRDVKPSNVLLEDDDFAYLIDFGIARAATDTDMTGTSRMIGTWAYMAPERFTTPDIDARSDVYALACVLHECLTGKRPFPGDTPELQFGGHLGASPPRPSVIRSGVPSGFDAVIATGLAKDPKDRHQTTLLLAAAARSALSSDPSTPPHPSMESLETTSAAAERSANAPSTSAGTVRGFGWAEQRRQSRPSHVVPSHTHSNTLGEHEISTRGGRKWWRRPPLVIAVSAIAVVACVAAVVTFLPQGTANETSAQPTRQALPAGQLRIEPFQMPSVSAPDPALATSPVVSAVQPSIVKILAKAPECGNANGGVIASTGFVVAPARVMTSAHTLAGSTSVSIVLEGRLFDATVVSHNASADIAIVAVDGLPGKPLPLVVQSAPNGSNAVVPGYPETDDLLRDVYKVVPARIAELVLLQHNDIYDRQLVEQEVYTFVGSTKAGDSGAPLLDINGGVVGMVFALAVDRPDVGFAMSASELQRQLSQVGNTRPESTGACVQ